MQPDAQVADRRVERRRPDWEPCDRSLRVPGDRGRCGRAYFPGLVGGAARVRGETSVSPRGVTLVNQGVRSCIATSTVAGRGLIQARGRVPRRARGAVRDESNPHARRAAFPGTEDTRRRAVHVASCRRVGRRRMASSLSPSCSPASRRVESWNGYRWTARSSQSSGEGNCPNQSSNRFFISPEAAVDRWERMQPW